MAEDKLVADTSDGELVERARSGDVRAFERLYHRHVGRIYAICFRIAADPVRADELVQETFLKVWSNLQGYRGESPVEYWIRRIAVNCALVTLRTARRRGKWEVLTDDAEETDESHEIRAAAIDLEAAIASLPDRARAVLVLHDIEGFRHDEIAQQMNIAEGTSKAHLARARQLLREALR